MATKIARISDFLKGFLLGLWIGFIDPFGTRYGKKGEKLLQRRREAAAEEARIRSEIGIIPPKK
jgi:hypothetical protein